MTIKPKIEYLISELSDTFGFNYIVNNPQPQSYLVQSADNNVTLVIWDRKYRGSIPELVLGSINVKSKCCGTGTYMIEELKKLGKNTGYKRLVLNKTERTDFFEKRGFIPDDNDPQDYYCILK